mgnify:CR=1 FL=1|tara:strand:- start:7034 stop:7708 length:675 start_codon:yes stop_codon:yes gene_type:complete
MTDVVVVEKSGNLKSVNVKTLKKDELYKIAGFKVNKNDDFKLHHKFAVEDSKFIVCVYGKTNGRANQENKYDFPPPIDNTLFFGNVLLIMKKGDKFVSMTTSKWKTIYEELFGGFEEIGSEDSEEDEEDEEDEELPRTSTGYVKDDFVVDDEEDEEDELDDSDDEDEFEEIEEDDEEIVVETEKKVRRSNRIKEKKTENIFVFANENEDDLDYTSELEEEEYVL